MPPKGGDYFPLTYGDFDRTSPRWSPDGNRIAFISNETGDTTLWLFHWFGGKLEQIETEKLVYKRPMGKLRVKIVDDGSGGVTAARVHLNASDGRSYAPQESWLRVDWIMYDHMDEKEYHYFHTGRRVRDRPAAGQDDAGCRQGVRVLSRRSGSDGSRRPPRGGHHPPQAARQGT